MRAKPEGDHACTQEGAFTRCAQGMGKTIELMALIMSSQNEPLEVYGGLISSRTTLIIVPPAILEQWVTEIKKSVGSALCVLKLDSVPAADDIPKYDVRKSPASETYSLPHCTR